MFCKFIDENSFLTNFTEDISWVIKELKSSYIELPKNFTYNERKKYYFKDGVIKETSYDDKLINGVFNFKLEIWEETAPLEEQIECYKNIIIQKTREHELLKASGFTGTQEEINLKIEIENLKQIYMDKNHELALQIENRLK